VLPQSFASSSNTNPRPWRAIQQAQQGAVECVSTVEPAVLDCFAGAPKPMSSAYPHRDYATDGGGWSLQHLICKETWQKIVWGAVSFVVVAVDFGLGIYLLTLPGSVGITSDSVCETLYGVPSLVSLTRVLGAFWIIFAFILAYLAVCLPRFGCNVSLGGCTMTCSLCCSGMWAAIFLGLQVWASVILFGQNRLDPANGLWKGSSPCAQLYTPQASILFYFWSMVPVAAFACVIFCKLFMESATLGLCRCLCLSLMSSSRGARAGTGGGLNDGTTAVAPFLVVPPRSRVSIERSPNDKANTAGAARNTNDPRTAFLEVAAERALQQAAELPK
jgi:hypothetical protein